MLKQGVQVNKKYFITIVVMRQCLLEQTFYNNHA